MIYLISILDYISPELRRSNDDRTSSKRLKYLKSKATYYANKMISHIHHKHDRNKQPNIHHIEAKEKIHSTEQAIRTKPSDSEPTWKKRWERVTDSTEKGISQITAALHNNGKLNQTLVYKHHFHQRNTKTAIKDATLISQRQQWNNTRGIQFYGTLSTFGKTSGANQLCIPFSQKASRRT